MNRPESGTVNIERTKADYLKAGLRAAALGIGMVVISAPAAQARGQQPRAKTAEMYVPAPLGPVITAAEHRVSDNIGSDIPIRYRKAIAYFNGGPDAKEDFFIANPLWMHVKQPGHHKKVELIGFIEPKGGPTGPVVDFFPYNPITTSLTVNPYDAVKGGVMGSAIFPSTGDESYDINNAVNPLSGHPILNRYGLQIEIGQFYAPETLL